MFALVTGVQTGALPMSVAARHFLETLARPADREALFVEQAANPAHHLYVVLLVVTAIAAPLHRLELREFLFPVAQYVRLDLAQLADFADGEVTLGREDRKSTRLNSSH